MCSGFGHPNGGMRNYCKNYDGGSLPDIILYIYYTVDPKRVILGNATTNPVCNFCSNQAIIPPA